MMLDGVGKLAPSVGPSGIGGANGAAGLAQPSPVTSTPNTVRTEPLPTDFGTVIGQMTLDAISTLRASEQTSIAGVRGQATTQQVVEAVMAAEQTLQASVAIRDKVVSAYLEISRMTI
jgi:flagellar hook-basal body complex protein FliE